MAIGSPFRFQSDAVPDHPQDAQASQTVERREKQCLPVGLVGTWDNTGLTVAGLIQVGIGDFKLVNPLQRLKSPAHP